MLKVTELAVSDLAIHYPEYWHLDGSRDWRPTDREVFITIHGTRFDLYHKLGLGEKWIHEFNGWWEEVDWDVHPDDTPCKLKGETVLDRLVELGIIDDCIESHIRQAMNPEPCEGGCYESDKELVA